MLYYTNAVLLLLNTSGGPASTFLIAKILSLVIPIFTIFLILIWWKKIAGVVAQKKLIWVLMGFLIVSVFWSDAPEKTLTSWINLLKTTLLAVFFAGRYSSKEQLRLLAWMFGISVLLCLVFGLALPSYGVMGMGAQVDGQNMAHVGTWRGVYTHKNLLGRNMVLSTVVFLLFANSGGKHYWLGWLGCIFSVALILLSTSKSALIGLLTILCLLPFYRALRWNYTLAVPFFISVILVGGSTAMVLVGNAEAILGAFGRDLTLTGRTELWAAVLDKIWNRPWLGYGYSGFWQGWNGESADIWLTQKWLPPHSHNGFLDLWVDLGLLGLLLFVLSFLIIYFQSVIYIRFTKTAEGLFPLTYLTYMVLVNLTESSLVKPDIFWFLYVAVTLSINTKSANTAKSILFWQQKENGGVMKPIKQG